jgi:FAD/FMN-containing dehydrogenase
VARISRHRGQRSGAGADGSENYRRSWRRKFFLDDQTDDRQKLWRARHDVFYADRALRPGAEILATDVCVPISRLAECIIATEKDVAVNPAACYYLLSAP